jgi:hypothetical protein
MRYILGGSPGTFAKYKLADRSTVTKRRSFFS